jgi:hypothetical protein
MITREQAIVAKESLSAVFGPDGMEVTVLAVHSRFPSVVGTDNGSLERRVYHFGELTPSREVTSLASREG